MNMSPQIDLPEPQPCSCATGPLTPASMADLLPMLQAFVERAPGMRPFLCDGNPLTCTVAIIGGDFGDAPSFWPHWCDEKGMNRRSWTQADRALHPGAIDGVQARLERFLPQIAQRVIELNVPATQINGDAQPSEDYRAIDILQFILGVVKPHTVICVGAAALRVVHSMALSGTPTIFATREFIHWDIDYEHALADEVNNPTAATTSGQRPRTAKSRAQTGLALRSWLAGLR
jgi:hypothetical protein